MGVQRSAMTKLERLLMQRQSYIRFLKKEEANIINGPKHKKRIIVLRREINTINQEIIRNLDEH